MQYFFRETSWSSRVVLSTGDSTLVFAMIRGYCRIILGKKLLTFKSMYMYTHKMCTQCYIFNINFLMLSRLRIVQIRHSTHETFYYLVTLYVTLYIYMSPYTNVTLQITHSIGQSHYRHVPLQICHSIHKDQTFFWLVTL